MLDVARNAGTDCPVSLAAVADHASLSRGYLEQLALSLRNAQLLRGVCGKGGGYKLSREPEEITIRDIVEAVIGPINVVECVMNPAVCERSETCSCRQVYVLINRQITDALDSFNLGDLLDPEKLRELIEQDAVKALPGPRTGSGRRAEVARAGRTRRLATKNAAGHDKGGCPEG